MNSISTRSHAAPPAQREEANGVSTARLPATLQVHRDTADVLVVAPGGNWLLRSNLPGIEAVEMELSRGMPPRRMEFDTTGLGEWNSGLVSFTLKCHSLCESHHLPLVEETLPPGLRKLLRLAVAVPETKDARHDDGRHSPLYRLGDRAIAGWSREQELMSFLGEGVLAFFKLLRGKAQLRWADAWLAMQQCGPEALGVVALINFLVGVILAFVGAVQLKQVGASIFVADLVAIGTVREMGCIMTGVILCGRTGAAFAAQLGAMKVNEELDAFRTFGISPIEYLVLPRVLALLLMMPLLCVFADAIAIGGGYLVSISMLDVTSTEYLRRTIEAIKLQSFLLGISKGAFFGVVVAVSGCLRGMQCGTNAAAVGQATTSSVVTGITVIVAADGIFAVLCNALKI
jgi:phospholipid/cholesterol/gamma-HCH transport system permease protein